jgi:hypothetical protein
MDNFIRIENETGAETTNAFLRRHFLLGLSTAISVPRTLFGDTEDVIDLNWQDLLPEGKSPLPEPLRGLVQHDAAPLASKQLQSSGLRSDWNGKIVRLPGYVVPLDFDGTAVTSFILVPFVGACVHVPPPPANQLVLVITGDPYIGKGLFEPVNVTGIFGTAATSTQLAEIGYSLSAEKIEPYPQ